MVLNLLGHVSHIRSRHKNLKPSRLAFLYFNFKILVKFLSVKTDYSPRRGKQKGEITFVNFLIPRKPVLLLRRKLFQSIPARL